VSELPWGDILRTLRIDFEGRRVVLGEDETGQLVTELNPKRADVTVREDSGGTAEFFADVAADWVERELRAPSNGTSGRGARSGTAGGYWQTRE